MPGAGAPWGRPKDCKDRGTAAPWAWRKAPKSRWLWPSSTLPTGPACSRVAEPPWPVSLSFLVSQLQLARPLLIFST